MSTSTRSIMWQVNATLLPGIFAYCWWFGWQLLVPIGCAVLIALLTEALCVSLRRAPNSMHRLRDSVTDGSSVLTALILVLALPPGVPLALIAFAVVVAIILGKQVYGGLGQNLFNPAMVGYAALLISFPKALALWPTLDGTTAATALTSLHNQTGTTIEELWQSQLGFGTTGGYGFEWINLAFLSGGLILLMLRIISWRMPIAFILTLSLLALAFYDNGSSNSHGSPALALFSGGTMLAAFYVVTDPVTQPIHKQGQWLAGALMGLMVFCIRAFGSFPDGIAFAVLFVNSLTPFINQRLNQKLLNKKGLGVKAT